MKKFIGTALVLCCLALPLAGCEDAISTVISTTMSELEDIPNQILATPESAEMKPEYNYIHFRYDNIWTVSASDFLQLERLSSHLSKAAAKESDYDHRPV